MKAEHLAVWYLVFPLYTLLTISAMIADLPPLRIADNFNWFQVLIVTPFYLGVVAAPGWLHAWSGHCDREQLSYGRRIWVESSLWLALLAGLGGLISIVAVIPFPGVIGSLIAAALMLKRFYASE